MELFKKIISKIKIICKNIYKIKIESILYVGIATVLSAILFEILRNTIPNMLNIHLGFVISIDYFAVYSCILGLILPLAIMLIEKIHNERDYILVETYLKNTMMFPFIIYFCINLVILIILKEQYYFIFSSFISISFIIYMYYKSFKLLSDLRYEKEKIGATRYEIVNDELDDQIKHFSDENVIQQYLKYGIKIERYDYIETYNYKKTNIYPVHDLRKIEQYNYKSIEKMVKKLKVINKEYLDYSDINDDINNKEQKKPKIIVSLLDIGSTTQKDRSCITIYYDSEYEKQATDLMELLSEKIYITSETNNHFYIKANYEYLQNDCIKAINDSSSTLLSNNLDKYLDIYKDYINAIKTKIGDYSYETAYSQTHSFYEPRAYEILKLIREDIRDYSQVILRNDNPNLMNELISFLYDMIIYSYTKNELLSIQYLDSLYNFLNYQSLKLSDNKNSYGKIKLEVFEFLNLVKYDLKIDNKDFNKDILLICNKTISSIMFELSKKNDRYFFQYLRKVFEFINNIYDELEQVQDSENEADIIMTNIYKEILINFNCNFFATLAYVVIRWENKNKDITNILNIYKDYDTDRLSEILLDSINKDFNDNTYSWDLLEDRDFDETDGMWNVNTSSYLIHLYCLLLNKVNSSRVILPLSYPLSTHSGSIIKEFENLNNNEMADKFNKLVEDIDNQEKEYIRNTPIIQNKVDNFKSKFIENYYKDAELYDILDKTNNLKKVSKRKKGPYYLGINNIVDKTYFLQKMPNDRTIVWTNFEDSFADSFINSEEKKYSELLEKKSVLIDDSILSYFEKNNIDYSKYIMFADYSTIYGILTHSNITYQIPSGIKYNGLKANKYFNYNNNFIPIFSINGLNDGSIYLLNINEMGKMEKYCDDFEIEIKDFYNNNKLINEYMSSKINGLDLQDDERRNHLLESVNIFIREYIRFDDKKMTGIKFEK